MKELQLSTATTPISATAEDAAATQVQHSTALLVFCVIDSRCTRSILDETFQLTHLPLLVCTGVATYCKDSATPFAAEEGLSGQLTSHDGAVGCYGDHTEFSSAELQLLDNEGRAMITQHRVM